MFRVFFPIWPNKCPCSADSSLKCEDWSGLFWPFIYHCSSSSLHRSPEKSTRMKLTRFLFFSSFFLFVPFFCFCCSWQSNSYVIGKNRIIAIYFFLHSGQKRGEQEDFVPELPVVWSGALISVIICCLKMPAGGEHSAFSLPGSVGSEVWNKENNQIASFKNVWMDRGVGVLLCGTDLIQMVHISI